MELGQSMSAQMASCHQLGELAWLNEAKGSNFVFSPFSIYAALCLLAPGAGGTTLQELLTFLKSESLAHLNSTASQLVHSLKQDTDDGGFQLSFVNGVWIERSLSLKHSFKHIVNSIYKAEAEAVDFITQPNEEREKINKWVETETNGLVKNLLPDKSIEEKTVLVLANALYFKGAWAREFPEFMTKNSKFYLLDGTSVQVPMMSNIEDQIISTFDDFKVLQLPYKSKQEQHHYYYQHGNPRFSMYIFLPNDRNGLHDLIEKVGADSRFIEQHLPTSQVAVGDFKVPKFKISFGFDASSVLQELGLVMPFDDRRAELCEMITESLDLFVSGAYHKCSVEVNEGGTVAAAASAIVAQMQTLRTPTDFVADHPFMFIIRDNVTGAVLFMGFVLNPLLISD